MEFRICPMTDKTPISQITPYLTNGMNPQRKSEKKIQKNDKKDNMKIQKSYQGKEDTKDPDQTSMNNTSHPGKKLTGNYKWRSQNSQRYAKKISQSDLSDC